jgi:hypothetical protein
MCRPLDLGSWPHTTATTVSSTSDCAAEWCVGRGRAGFDVQNLRFGTYSNNGE